MQRHESVTAQILVNHHWLGALLLETKRANFRIVLSSFNVHLFDSKFPKVPTALRSAFSLASARGVEIRVLSANTLSPKTVSELPVAFRVFPKRPLLHAKFAVFDTQRALLGGHNLTYRGSLVNEEVSVLLEHPALAAELEQHFAKLWLQGVAPPRN